MDSLPAPQGNPAMPAARIAFRRRQHRMRARFAQATRMYAGLDYGTSNCAIGIPVTGAVELVPLEDDHLLMPSTLHAPRQDLLYRIGSTLSRLTPETFQEFSFGRAATAAYLEDPASGFYMKSPKSFLGARGISPEVQQRFTVIVTGMLQHIFSTTARHRGEDIRQVVIGRPVNFQGAGGESDNRRALSILEDAAKACGVQDVAFLFEPMAAALELEARQNAETTVLVVDIGGGTTDCSFIRIGPSRRDRTERGDDVLGHVGERIGGNDYDQLLAFHALMPALGQGGIRTNGLPIPNHLFMDAVSINDVNAQQRFYAQATRDQLLRYLQELGDTTCFSRLLALRDSRATFRFVAAAEGAKIRLSDAATTTVPLDFIDTHLQVTLSEAEFARATEKLLAHLHDLLTEVIRQGSSPPELVYLTGGMARSPLTRACIRAALPHVPLVDSNHFLSVTEGLAIWSQRLFGGARNSAAGNNIGSAG